ncbi:hypothetical protein [Paraburkholderia nodosa]|uniref:hypothetical protein n=1 Tax=Paraburkholderia nodosa TaxID=392320 RepID=UPI0004896882|nr:hypothetical protein [Paraburkholderia nodosa]
MTLVLTTEVPTMVATSYRGRVSYQPGFAEHIARVRVVRRIRLADGSLDPERAEVEVYVPEDRRAGIEAPRDAWVTPEYLRCRALRSKNRRSLRDFFESDVMELAV